MANSKLQSYHIFLFPFSWDYYPDTSRKKNSGIPSFESRTEIKSFENLLNKEHWPPLNFKSDLVKYYNDFAF